MRTATISLMLLQAALTSGKFISVSNGGEKGTWGGWDMCPNGTAASGFSLSTEDYKGWFVDDTAVNGVCLYCTKPSDRHTATVICSSFGTFGKWGQILWCPIGYLNRFQLRVYSGTTDNTGVTNIRFQCSDSTVLEVPGLDWGEYGEWSNSCNDGGFLGLNTLVQEPQGLTGDDSALNDVNCSC